MIETGTRFGRLVVQKQGENYVSPKSKTELVRYNCICDCGNEKLIRESSLINGYTKSCGCMAKEMAGNRLRTHGLSKHPLADIWYGMNKRCYNSSRKDYKHYGGRGITICEEWLGVPQGLRNFIKDMEKSYLNGLEIDRIDVDGNYSKENCRWVTRREQVINRRDFDSSFNAKLFTINDKTLCISQWAENFGLSSALVSDRLRLGWKIEDALTIKPRTRQIKVIINGDELFLKNIFRNPPNVASKAARLQIETSQLVANMFYNIGEVYALINKKWVFVPSSKNESNRLLNSVLIEAFINKYNQIINKPL